MILHPVVLAVVALDLLVLAAAMPAVTSALAVLEGWVPGSAAAKQIRLERRVEASFALIRPAVLVFCVSSILLVVALSMILPDLVPGAMCGTGVMQAIEPLGLRVLVLRGLAVALLLAWWTVDALGRSSPRTLLTSMAARTLLLAVGPLVLAVIDSARALTSLDGQRAVDCCAAVYDAVRIGAPAAASSEAGPWVLLSLIGPASVVGFALLARRGVGSERAPLLASLTVVLVGAWIFAATKAVTGTLASAHYGVLAHECPWCLFAARHRAMGWPIWGSLAVVAAEAVALVTAMIVSKGNGTEAPEVVVAAGRRVACASGRIAASSALFVVAAALPTLLWRLRHGVWIAG